MPITGKMSAAAAASLSQRLGWTEFLPLWRERARAQSRSLILGSGWIAASESHPLTNPRTESEVAFPTPLHLLCPITSRGARNASTQQGREPHKPPPPAPELIPVAQPKDTQEPPSLPSLPPAANPLGLEASRRDRNGKA